jgi:predicted amidohydrolase
MPGSVYQIEHGKVFNVAPVIDPTGAVVARYRKMFPFRPHEEGVTGGDAFCVLPMGATGTLGVSICYDLWFPETTRSLVWMGAEALICPTLTNTIDRDVELAIARATAAGCIGRGSPDPDRSSPRQPVADGLGSWHPIRPARLRCWPTAS